MDAGSEPYAAWRKPDAGSAVVDVDGQGRIHVLVNRSGQQIWYLRVEGEVRTAFEFLANGVSPSIAGDSSGQAHVVWSEGWEIRYRRWRNGWDSRVTTISDGGGNALRPHICTDASRNVHVVWDKAGNTWYDRRSAATGLWDGPQQVTFTNDLLGYFGPRVAANDAAPLILWGRNIGGQWSAWFTSRESGAWVTTQLDGAAGCSNGDLDVEPDGVVTAAWDRGYDIWSRRRVGGVWSGLTLVRGGDASSFGPRVCSVSSTRIDLVWRDNGSGLNDIWSGRWSEGAWSTGASITAGHGGVSPEIARDAQGIAYVVWSRDWDIWLATSASSDGTAPPSVGNLAASTTPGQATLTWANPRAIDLARVRVVHHSNRFPLAPNDGDVVLDRPASWGNDGHTHPGLSGLAHYYAVFVADDDANWSPPAWVAAILPTQADFDVDRDVDLGDFSRFQTCFNGPNRSPIGVAGCEITDLDGDHDADLADFSVFQRCFNGPNRLPACGG